MSEEVQQQPSTPLQRVFNGFNTVRPTVHLVLTVAMAIGLYVVSQRDLAFSQGSATQRNTEDLQTLNAAFERRKAEIDGKIDRMSHEMLTREVFEAYHAGDQQRLDRMEKMLDQLIRQQEQ